LRIVVLLLCLLLLPINAHAAQRLRVAYFIFEPHVMVVDGSCCGAAIDYFTNQIAPEMGVEVDIVGPVPFGRLLSEFEAEKYDAVLLLAKNEEREAQFVYPAEPFGYMESALIANREFNGTLTEAGQLAGWKIGYAQKAWMSPFMRNPKLDLDLVSARYATEINFRKLNEGRLDAVYSPDRWSLVYAAARHDLKAEKILSVPGLPVGYYTVFSRRVSPDVVRSYERALRNAQARLPYEKSVELFIGKAANR